MLRGSFLHTTSQRGKGYIAYRLPKAKMGLKTMWPRRCNNIHNRAEEIILHERIYS